ncbi:hypothetical protein Q4599_01020 [Cellulophaga lytica]|uniref:hypothetical protein n=1 Tax=Cellulophaga lytica TaxID=979 RepID=UPI0026E400C9|nr:hypothetical protein [Cellulophaga lytica]MDO6852143.1 hypothetical protein [Cellulophaga lytica]
MTDKELRILFLRTKLEHESENLNSDDFYKKIEHKIGWKQYNDIYSEYANNSFFDYQTHTKLTELGRNTLKKLEIEYEQELKDKKAERKKLHNESVMSGWKRKTFWYIFALGLFGGIYSGIDLFNKITSSKEVQEEQLTKQEMESELSELRSLILSQKSQGTLVNPKAE